MLSTPGNLTAFVVARFYTDRYLIWKYTNFFERRWQEDEREIHFLISEELDIGRTERVYDFYQYRKV